MEKPILYPREPWGDETIFTLSVPNEDGTHWFKFEPMTREEFERLMVKVLGESRNVVCPPVMHPHDWEEMKRLDKLMEKKK